MHRQALLSSAVDQVGQRTLHQFAVNQFRFALECGRKVLLWREKGLGRHLPEE